MYITHKYTRAYSHRFFCRWFFSLLFIIGCVCVLVSTFLFLHFTVYHRVSHCHKPIIKRTTKPSVYACMDCYCSRLEAKRNQQHESLVYSYSYLYICSFFFCYSLVYFILICFSFSISFSLSFFLTPDK